MSNKTIQISNKLIGENHPVFIIAEVGVNHNGSLELAKKLVDVAVEAGVDAVKFQTFTAEFLVTQTAKQADYQERNIGKTESQFDMLKRLELKKEYHSILQEYCNEKGLIFLSAPFFEQDADFLETLDVDAYKIPSGEINNLSYLRHIGKKGKPMIVSTGMSSMEEVKAAVNTLKEVGNEALIFLHCTSNYPASPGSLNLRAINTMREELENMGVLVGYSDHSKGYTADIVATAFGACLIEKHFTLDKNMEGPDHQASMEPDELKEMVAVIRDTETMLGTGEKCIVNEEKDVRDVARKSIIAKVDILEGQTIDRDNLIAKRPGTGIAPAEIETVIGKKARVNILADTIIKREDLI